jgi:hypothetical protein
MKAHNRFPVDFWERFQQIIFELMMQRECKVEVAMSRLLLVGWKAPIIGNSKVCFLVAWCFTYRRFTVNTIKELV